MHLVTYRLSSQILSVWMTKEHQSPSLPRACSEHLPATFLSEISPGEILPGSFHHSNGTNFLSLTRQVKQNESQALPPWLSLQKKPLKALYPEQMPSQICDNPVDFSSTHHTLSVTKTKRNLYFQVIRLSRKQFKEVLREDKRLKLIKFSFKYLKSK